MSKNCVLHYHFPMKLDPGNIVHYRDDRGNESSFECIDASGTLGCMDCDMFVPLCVSVDCVLHGSNVIYKKIKNE